MCLDECSQEWLSLLCLRVWQSVSVQPDSSTYVALVSPETITHTHTHTPSAYSALYQIAHLGDNDDETEFSSSMPLEEGETFFFAPRGLKNLVQADEIESLSPIISCQVGRVGEWVGGSGWVEGLFHAAAVM